MIFQNEGGFIKKGRGAQFNPLNRFASQAYVQAYWEGIDDWEEEQRRTTFIYENSKTIVNKVKSEDVHMLFSLNPYQGCEHGCIYCYARPTHEYWGYSAGVDFESKIVVKKNAPELLRKFFDNKNWEPAVLSLSGNTDCYQPVERQMKITRQLLEVCLEYRNPLTVLTKNALVLRDMDIIQELAAHNLIMVLTSVTSTRKEVREVLEPRTSSYATRFNIVKAMAAKGIPTGIMFAPIIPGINDTDMAEVLQQGADAGALWAGYTIVRLNGALEPLFKDWLHKMYPQRAEKVWNLIKSCHKGNVHDYRPGTRMAGDGVFAELIKKQFKLYCGKFGLNKVSTELNRAAFRRPPKGGQMSLF